MSKIRELEQVIGSGARNNKYRVLFPFMGAEIDIQTHDITAPGRSIGIAEVFLKGRKYQLAGDRADEGTITMTFYNDPDLYIRRFFLQMISDIQSYDLPATMDGGVDNFTNLLSTNSRQIVEMIDEIRYNILSIKGVFDDLNRRSNSTFFDTPWYQFDLRIQQLDHNGDMASEAIYENAFISDVSGIEYHDEVGDISTTTVTIAYTSVSYRDKRTYSTNRL